MPPSADPARDPPPAQSAAPASFEEGLSQLADIVTRLEAGGLGLTESIAAYERGVVLLRGLHEELARAEERIRILTEVDADGRPISEPFPGPQDGAAHEPTMDGGAASGRRPGTRVAAARKPPPRSATLPGMDDSRQDA